MAEKQVIVSKEFKKKSYIAILTILLFIFTYLILIALAIGITFGCGYLGLLLFSLRISIYTIIIGAGLISMGILILIFLFKFIFKKHVHDLSDLIEITKKDEPILFEMIKTLAAEVKTPMPKRVYLTPEVNASVFFDSGFWSMLLPVKKNLVIGLGLVNSTTVDEFKSILAHEFGHFSQRSMHIGSYVFNVNQIIYNLLFDNDSYNSFAESISKMNRLFSLFVIMAIYITDAIKWILSKIYIPLNVSHLGLSREMEFHADQIAAMITGPKIFSSALLRLEIADRAFMLVSGFYAKKEGEPVLTKNVFPQQNFMMNFLATENKLTISNNFPVVSLDYVNKMNKSKLIIKNQWASHPGIQERVASLQKLEFKSKNDSGIPANTLFKNPAEYQTKMTAQYFEGLKIEEPLNYIDDKEFEKLYTDQYNEISYARIFNGYYDLRGPAASDEINSEKSNENITIEDLFSDIKVEIVNTMETIENDLETLNQIKDKKNKIKSFEYDGKQYARKDCDQLIEKLNHDQTALKFQINENDKEIYRYFRLKAEEQNKREQLAESMKIWLETSKIYEEYIPLYIKINNNTQFMHITTKHEEIELNLAKVRVIEVDFRGAIEAILNMEILQPYMKDEVKKAFEEYLSRNWSYFTGYKYNQKSVDVLFAAMFHYKTLLLEGLYFNKRNLLSLMEQLEFAKI